jgi:ABC-type polysaccharide/polyol phosphate transport system ATPase subunit
MIKSVCNKAALMVAGQIAVMGPVDDMFDEYHTLVHGVSPKKTAERSPDKALRHG